MRKSLSDEERRQKNREKVKHWCATHRGYYNAYRRRRYAENASVREKHRARGKVYREQNRQKASEISARWWKAHPEKRREKQRRQRAKNLEHVRELDRQRYVRDREKRLAAQLTYQKAHRKEANARNRKWAAAHPAEALTKVHRRLARKRNAPGSHTAAEWAALCVAARWRCFYADIGRPGCTVDLNERTATRDHKVPLSRGGSNCVENLTIACLSCNSAKGARTESEFIARGA
jgi:5-methylcytosine-specific restriction endonuclease McrA